MTIGQGQCAHLDFYCLPTYYTGVKKIILTQKELARRDVINAFNMGLMTRVSAAERLAVTVRQLHILRKRYRYQGDEGLIDRRRFTKGNFSKPAPLKAQVMGLIRVDYAGLGPTAVCRKLASECGLALHLGTVRQWMTKAGISTARRGSYQIREADKAARIAKPDPAPSDRSAYHRSGCLPPRLFRESRAASPFDKTAIDNTTPVSPALDSIPACRNAEEICAAQGQSQEPDQIGRTPTLAELEALFAAKGTSAEALDELVVTYAIQLMDKLGRPVTEDQIGAYIDKCDPDLRPVLELIDAGRAAETEHCRARGKRLTHQQRQAILVMLHQGVRPSNIARTFGISTGAISTYQRQLRAMDEEDHAGALNITRFQHAV